jgi:putative ABC transport system permease protein
MEATANPLVLHEGEAAVTASARPIATRAGALQRVRTMVLLGLSMMFFDKAKLIGTVLGVVFAVVLTNQQLGIGLGLVDRNVMFVDHAKADLWIAPPSTETLQGGRTVPMSALYAARTTPGVARADPLLFSGGVVKTPSGGTEAITLIGTKYPQYAGGPWNIVAGDASALRLPDTMTFEDSERETLGNLNLGSVREVNGRRMTAGAFTWGLEPFGPSYAFVDYETARELMHTTNDEASYVLVGLEPGQDPLQVKRAIEARTSGVKLMTKAEFETSIRNFVLFKQSLGASIGASALFGVIVGFVIVALSMFSSVIDRLREFGTLKAVGATNGDLAVLLLGQSVAYAWIGSLVGLFLVTRMAAAMRSPKLTLLFPPALTIGTIVGMTLICVFASTLALLRIRKVEPAMVFR